jgi:PPOX class probable F420-dependent enzyme
MASPLNGFYDRIRHPSARDLANERSTVLSVEHLRGHKYCLLVTYRRTGQAVPTPVWFGLSDGKVYIRSDTDAAKIKRIRNDPRTRLAPCTARGKPLGPPARGRARLLDQQADVDVAEAALSGNYGFGRKLYERAGGAFGVETVYLEVTPG